MSYYPNQLSPAERKRRKDAMTTHTHQRFMRPNSDQEPYRENCPMCQENKTVTTHTPVKEVCNDCEVIQGEDCVTLCPLHAAATSFLKALQSIAANSCCDKCQEAALVARAVIKKAIGLRG